MHDYTNFNTLERLFKFIDNMKISTAEYDIILNMIENYDAKLFVKIVEEISKGKIDWIDFKQILNIDLNQFEDSIKNQEELYSQVVLLNQINKETAQNYNNLLTTYKKVDGQNIISAELIEKENKIMSMLSSNTGDPLNDFYNLAVINKIIKSDNSDFIDSMLLSVHDYIVPVDYNFIQLNKDDLIFAKNNNLTIEDMKKIKSLAAFASNYYDGDNTSSQNTK